ncbi:MAG: galactokinase [Candidatus Abyssobacteria bacterium SURF_5]|uniref:Galactokinase n=1 Tax=Abyssobacteria bacterium (strain SURF_5) TaxID=2093360 RepID=A0A3A4N877_ABYX5|nr:MAG: galactokinase [Candidatus Abyssubacteria bacterium SURF_5]
MEKIERFLFTQFAERFGHRPQAQVWAPGRINLIGEHTDYNDGFVLPIAIGKRIYAAASIEKGKTMTLCSANIRGEVTFNLSEIEPGGDWGDYPKGVVAELLKREYPLQGLNAFFLSDLPIGAGVSSSAAMEVVTCYLMQRLFGFSLPPEEAAYLCQRAEHSFSGTRCGIMDQFASIMGVKDNALFLDCRTLDYRRIPCQLDDYVLVACDSRVERELAASEYNRRRAECEEGVRVLAENYEGIRALRDANLSQLEAVSALLNEQVSRRCRHVITENERVLKAIQSMEARDWSRLGILMNESHESLRFDYEVSCNQLDFLVETSREIEGVLGARLTGAGFGGSTINLVHMSAVEEFQASVSEEYLKRFEIVPRIFACIASDGAEQDRLRS